MNKIWKAESMLRLLYRSASRISKACILDFSDVNVSIPSWVRKMQYNAVLFAAGDTVQGNKTDIERNPQFNIFCYLGGYNDKDEQLNLQYALSCEREIVMCKLDFDNVDQCSRFANEFLNSIDMCSTDDDRYYLAENFVFDILKDKSIAHFSRVKFNSDIPVIEKINDDLHALLSNYKTGTTSAHLPDGYRVSRRLDEKTRPILLMEFDTKRVQKAQTLIETFLQQYRVKNRLPETFGVDHVRKMYGFIKSLKDCPIGFNKNFVCTIPSHRNTCCQKGETTNSSDDDDRSFDWITSVNETSVKK